MSNGAFHTLIGEGIYFKPLSTDDTAAIHSFASDPLVSKFIGWRLMGSSEETEDFIKEMIKREAAATHLYASIVLKATGDIIGTAMIFSIDKEARHAEVGYVLHKSYWGKGYGTEALRLMNAYALDILKLRKLHARVVAANVSSVKILEKTAYQPEGRIRDYHFVEGNYYDSLLFGKFL